MWDAAFDQADVAADGYPEPARRAITDIRSRYKRFRAKFRAGQLPDWKAKKRALTDRTGIPDAADVPEPEGGEHETEPETEPAA
jgi:hypothetical protein